MAISLSKGGRVSLTKEAPGLKKIKVGLGWDVNLTDTGADFDLDASAFLIGKGGKVLNNGYFIFYGNTKSPCGAVVHTGDNRTGEGEGDDEVIEIDLDRLDSAIEKIVFTVTIYEADIRKQNFGQVDNSFIRIVNDANGKEIMRYELDEDYSTETAINFGELYRRNGNWNFKAVGAGFNNGLEGFCQIFGVNI